MVERGFVTYTNEAKIEVVGVPKIILNTHGAVSAETAIAMAEGGLEICPADLSVGVTGVAGPGGGTDLKPVGTVVFARVVRGDEGEPEGELKLFEPTSRADIRRAAPNCALELLLP